MLCRPVSFPTSVVSMTSVAEITDDRLKSELTRLVALSPAGVDGRIAALLRTTCAGALSMAALPVAVQVGEPETDAESVVVDFAEPVSVGLRTRLFSALGAAAFPTVVLMYIADFVPRVRAGLEALGVGRSYLDWVDGPVVWDTESDPSDALFNGFLPSVARLRALDPVTSEVVRLRGAGQHNCRLCKSLREGAALDAGGSEGLYGDIERYETSEVLTHRQKAALRYVDALVWTPGDIGPGVIAGLREHFSDSQAVELTFDVMRNASNKIAVSLGGDAPRVEEGAERYLIDAEGRTVFA
jgi:alkylhydroperoxidase family enzyme